MAERFTARDLARFEKVPGDYRDSLLAEVRRLRRIILESRPDDDSWPRDDDGPEDDVLAAEAFAIRAEESVDTEA